MQELPIIIIGAGASGLIAARELLKHHQKVTILEASNRAGGRIHTIQSDQHTIEAGAEFIHGNLPLTIGLLQEFKIHFVKTGGVMARIHQGKVKKTHEFVEDWDELIEAMQNLKTDVPLATFLSTNFGNPKYEKLRETASRFAEGFDLADPNTVSTMALYREWVSENDEEQYRIPEGYGKLIAAMTADCIQKGCDIKLSTPVDRIEWKKDHVILHAPQGDKFEAAKIIITVPMGVLQSGRISFTPVLPQMNMIGDVGFGTVVKIILVCKDAFWSKKIKNLGFIFSDEEVPTWWTQLPDHDDTLTGWLGGTKAKKLHEKNNDELLKIALDSLVNIFGENLDFIQSSIIHAHVFNWSKDPFSLGAYSFPTVHTSHARKIFNESIQNTIYFAGEAFYDGPVGGTVDAALNSGVDVVKKILNHD